MFSIHMYDPSVVVLDTWAIHLYHLANQMKPQLVVSSDHQWQFGGDYKFN